MDKELRILILEDVPTDAEIEEHELRKAGLVFTSKIVDTREAFLKALKEFSPDLILSDYKLPSFDGLAALGIAKEKCPDVPFILVTGELGEEFAIETLKKGVTDYVLKSNLKRLAPSVKRALEEAEEITERKRLRRVLKESERLYRLLAENTNDMITRHSPDGTYLYVSPACRTLFGYEPDELICTNAFAQMHPEDVKRVMTITQDSIRTGRSNVARYRHRTKEGQYVWVETTGKVVKNEITGTIEDIICVVRNISDRKQAEDEILRIKTEWENIFQAIGNPTIILDPDHNILSANQATITALGAHGENEIKGKKCYEFFHNANEPPEGCPLVKLRGSLQLTNVEMEVEALGGTYLISCTPIFDENGDLQKVIHIATDITDRKQMVESLKKSENKYKILIEHLQQKIFLKDSNLVYVSCNENYARDLRIKPDEIKGKTDYEFYSQDLADKYRKNDKKVLESGKSEEIEEKYILHGEEFWVNTVKTPVADEKGNIIGVLGIFWDITKRKKMEKEITQRMRDLEDFYQMSVGRELRMKELKEHINELKKRLDKYEKVDD